jgi:hypothetical protein
MVLFQFYGGWSGWGGGYFSDFVYWLDYWGVRDIILPFILIFTIFFAVLEKIHLFGPKDKKYNVVLSLAVALLVIIPHATGMYPAEADVVNIINDSIPEVALLAIVVVLLLFMVGLTGGTVPQKTGLTSLLAIAAMAILVMIFVNAMTPVPILQYIDPSIQALIVILLIFGLIIWFVTKEEPAQKKGIREWLWEEIGGSGGGKKPSE